MHKKLIVLLLAVAFIVPSFAVAQSPVKIGSKERKVAEAISAAQLKDYLYYVASDEMAGRDTPSQGLDLTAKFLGMMLSRWGLKPAGDNGTFYQKFDIRKETINPASAKLTVGEKSFKFADEYFRVDGETDGISGQLVFGKDGWMIKSTNIDSLSGVDVKGKIVVIAGDNFSQRFMIAPPKDVVPTDLAEDKRGVEWADPIKNAEMKGAAGVIVIAPAQLLGFWGQLRNFLGRGTSVVDKLSPKKADGLNMPVMLAGTVVRDEIFGAGNDATKAAVGDLGKNSEIVAKMKTEIMATQNVVAVWEGSDPKLKSEYVSIGAHYDHVGTNPNSQGPDKIWNGADDDGSGTVAVLAVAEALAKSPVRPKRSVLLVWHAGEEKGLWGSEYFNKFPTVDIKQVVTQLNIDMIGRSLDPNKIIKCDKDRPRPCNEELSGPNAIYVIGSEMMSSTLGAITKGTNDAYLKMTYDYKYDDPKDPNRFFFRSDHFNYAVNGIPVVFWFDGVHEDYHQPGDHADKIDYVKMEKVTRTIFLTLWKVAQLKERPKVDKKLPPELTQR